jgi:integrase
LTAARRYAYVSRIFRKLPDKYEIPHIRFHDLRNSTAINPLSVGFSLKDVQEWLCHSDIKTTANIYGHPDAKRKMALAG